ncbi:MAG: peptidylprolyl isomerase [Spirochaetales bacterium]|jgi:peptidyl-prolyl cis-trans isomerase C|nr:peptidylprolyl isomerase [Spirochaetales bacterium]
MQIRTMIRISLYTLAMAALIVLASCSGDKASKDTVATVNGEKITSADLDKAVEGVRAQFAAQGQPVADEEIAAFRSDVLENLIRNKILLNFAESKDISIDSSLIDAEIDGIRGQFPSEQEFKDALEGQGFTVKSLRKEISTGMTIERMLAIEVLEKIVISNEEIETFYAENPQFFARPESISARHILVLLEDDDTEDDKKKALAKIQSIRVEIAGGADFAAVAREKSEGPSASDGGSLGTFGRGQMVPEFEAAAFALEIGELSGIVQSEFGYHIIVVSEKLPEGIEPMESVIEDIREYLRQTREQGDVEQFIEELKQMADIEINELTPESEAEAE